MDLVRINLVRGEGWICSGGYRGPGCREQSRSGTGLPRPAKGLPGALPSPLSMLQRNCSYLCLHLLLSSAVALLVLVGSQDLLLDTQQDSLTAVAPKEKRVA